MFYITCFFFFFQAEDGIRDVAVTGVQTCALPISVLVLLGDRDHEAQVALDQLLHRLLVAGAHLPGERDLLLLGEEGRLRHLVEVLVEDIPLVLVGPETCEQTPAAPAFLGGLRLRLGGRRASRRHRGGRDSASSRAGLRPGGGGGLLPSDVLGHIYSPESPCDTGHRPKSSREGTKTLDTATTPG